MTPTKEQLGGFIELCRRERSIDFPYLAKICKLDFTSDIYPLLKTDPWFQDEVKKLCRELQYAALNAAFQKNPASAMVQEAMTSGFLWGADEEEESEEPEEEKPKPIDQAELLRLGLVSDTKPSSKREGE